MNARDTIAPQFRPTTAELSLVWFCRIVAAYCLAFGMLYWIRLIGVYPGPEWRFDTMPLHWQAAAAALAVLYPFASIGLWMMASWGPVIWCVCAIIEVVMYAVFPELFGARPAVIASHGAVAAIYAGLRLAIWLQKRARAQ